MKKIWKIAGRIGVMTNGGTRRVQTCLELETERKTERPRTRGTTKTQRWRKITKKEDFRDDWNSEGGRDGKKLRIIVVAAAIDNLNGKSFNLTRE